MFFCRGNDHLKGEHFHLQGKYVQSYKLNTLSYIGEICSVIRGTCSFTGGIY